MKFFEIQAILFALMVIGLFVPLQANATTPPAPVPEPVSLALLAAGLAGVGAAEIIRRRKGK